MRALIATGRPEALVALDEAQCPRPRPGEALVKVDAFSVNRAEMFLLGDPGPGWRPGEDLAILVRLVAAGRVHPEIGRVADWADTASALTDLRQRRIRGNTVRTISWAVSGERRSDQP